MTKPHQFHRPDLELEDHNAADLALERDLKRILSPMGLILDVGANRGQFATQVLTNFKDMQIRSFEPVPEAYADLVKVTKEYSQIIPYNMAISAQTGSANFFITESDVGSSLLEPLAGQPSKWLQTSRTETVKTKRLDEFIKEEKLGQINLLKSDTQGHDLPALLSAGEFLNPKHIKAILVEVNFQNFYKDQGNFSQLLETLTNKGYRLGWMYPHRAHDEWLWWADALFIEK